MIYKVGMLCKHFKGNNLLEKNIYRIEQIKKYHETGMFDFIDDILFEDGLLIAKVNQDWYVYVDNNKVIHSDIQEIMIYLLQKI